MTWVTLTNRIASVQSTSTNLVDTNPARGTHRKVVDTLDSCSGVA